MNYIIKIKVITLFIFFCTLSLSFATDPYDNDLKGKSLICRAESDSIDDWGIKFLEDQNLKMYSLDKFIYEIFQYKRTYRTNLRNIPQDNTTEAKYDELLERNADGSLKHSIWEKP